MAIRVRCSVCGQDYQLNDLLAGTTIECSGCRMAIDVPIGIPAPPQYGLSPPLPVASLPRPLPRPSARRTTNALPMLIAWVGVGLFSLVALGIIFAVVVKGIFASASANVAVAPMAPAQLAPPQPVTHVESAPVTLTGSYQPAAAVTPAKSPAEDVILKLLANLNAVNGLMAQVVDGTSANRLRGEILAKLNELVSLAQQLVAVARNISRQEDQRLDSLYMAQLKNGLSQLESNARRIGQLRQSDPTLAGQPWFDDFNDRLNQMHQQQRDQMSQMHERMAQLQEQNHQRMEELRARNRDLSRAAQPPSFQPPTIPSPPKIPRPNFNHGIRPSMPPRGHFGR